MPLHTCMLCEAVCGLEVELDDGKVTSIRGDARDPFSRGHICPKAAAIRDVEDDPDRVRQPQRRRGDRWEPIGWDEALDEAGERLARVQRDHGRHALGFYLGNPTVHSYTAALTTLIASRAFATRSRFSATSVDQLPHMLASLEMFGHQLRLPVPDVDRTHYFLILGGNPVVSNGSLMTAPDVAVRLRAIRERGGRVVVVDPRRTETAALADEHVSIRPGGDAFFLLAMLRTIFEEKLARPGRLAPLLDGLDELRAIAARFSPERVSARTGVAPDAIRRIARDFAAAPSAVAYGRVGLCTQEFGGAAAWLVVALNAVTGNLDRPGGFMFPTPPVDLATLTARLGDRGHFGVWKSRVRGLPEFGGELPAATLAEEIETPGDGQIRALVTFAGNPVLSTPDGRRLDRALAGLDYMVSIDLYRNETTRHANLILPTTFGFEREHFDLVFYLLAVRNAARWAPRLVDPPPGAREDWEILVDLASSLRRHGGGRRDRATGLMLRAYRAVGPRRIVDWLMRLGPHKGLSIAALERSPHGIDLGALKPRLPDALHNRERRVRLAPPLYARDVERLEAALDRGAPELVLIGRRQLRSNNSWMHNAARLVKGPSRCHLLMHPDDAAARGVRNGDPVRVTSRAGEVRVPVAITDEIARGVVSLPHGWGHDRDGAALAVAREHAGASLNDLVESRVDPLSGTAILNGVAVTVEPVASIRDSETAAPSATGTR